MDAKQFLSELFSEIDDSNALALWTREAGSRWYDRSEIDKMALDGNKAASRHDVYFNVCPQAKKLDSNHRGGEDTVASVVALWADLDCKKDGNKKNYFPDKATLKKFIDELPIKYSLLVDSSGGYHVYWLFDEPFVIESQKDWRHIAGLSRGWQGFIGARAEMVGYEIDYTADLARILRLPGTMHHGTQQKVVVADQTPNRWSPSDFAIHQAEVTERKTPANVIPVNAGMEPPFQKFQAMMANDLRFAATWRRERDDLKDSSPSAYCLALANMAIGAGWTEEETTRLLVAFRSSQPDADLKINRPEWYAATIQKARGSVQEADAIEHITSAPDAPIKDDGEKKMMLDSISKALGITVQKVIKMRPESSAKIKDKPRYMLVTNRGDIEFESFGSFKDYSRFVLAIGEEFDILIKPIKPKIWREVVQQMLNVIEHVETSPEGSEYEQVRIIITDYLSESEKASDPYTAYVQRYPYQDDKGVVYFSWRELVRKLRHEQGIKISNRRLSVILDNINCSRVTFENITDTDGTRRKVTMWRLK